MKNDLNLRAALIVGVLFLVAMFVGIGLQIAAYDPPNEGVGVPIRGR